MLLLFRCFRLAAPHNMFMAFMTLDCVLSVSHNVASCLVDSYLQTKIDSYSDTNSLCGTPVVRQDNPVPVCGINDS